MTNLDAARSRDATLASTTGMQAIRLGLVLTDTVMVGVAVAVAQVLRFGYLPAEEVAGGGPGYTVVSIGLAAAWVMALALAGAYRTEILGYGTQELRAVLRAAVSLFASLALVSYALQLLFARGYVLVAFPLGLVLTAIGRWVWRRGIARARRAGRLRQRVLAVGAPAHLSELLAATERDPSAGLVVEGVCCDTPLSSVEGVPVLGPEDDVHRIATEGNFDVVAWSGSRHGPTALRTLAWDLEPTKIGLLVMSDLTEVSHARVLSQPVSGVPLLHVRTAHFSGTRLVLKTVFDYVLAALLLLLTAPVQLVIALSILIAERGPVIYRQTRVGVRGQPFQILKFRTMVSDAERSAAPIVNDRGVGPLFKARHDPRVTRVGRFLRRFSLDELPQLINVLRGEMSLVGPRPPLPTEVAEYGPDLARRRVAVRPGITGLWQVSGRNDLTWAESIRLDLYYVDNWSITTDLVILAQTVTAVARGRGAY